MISAATASSCELSFRSIIRSATIISNCHCRAPLARFWAQAVESLLVLPSMRGSTAYEPHALEPPDLTSGDRELSHAPSSIRPGGIMPVARMEGFQVRYVAGPSIALVSPLEKISHSRCLWGDIVGEEIGPALDVPSQYKRPGFRLVLDLTGWRPTCRPCLRSSLTTQRRSFGAARAARADYGQVRHAVAGPRPQGPERRDATH